MNIDMTYDVFILYMQLKHFRIWNTAFIYEIVREIFVRAVLLSYYVHARTNKNSEIFWDSESNIVRPNPDQLRKI